MSTVSEFQSQQALHAEKQLVGRCMDGVEHIEAIAGIPTGDFQLDSHRRIIAAVRTMHADGRGVDPFTLAGELGNRHELDAVGGRSYLGDAFSSVILNSVVPTAEYVAVVRKAAAGRAILSLAETMQRRVADGDDAEQVLYSLQTHIADLEAASVRVMPKHASELVLSAWEGLEEEMRCDRPTIGVPTGIPDLDRVMGGWRRGELSYVGARPGTGKSGLMLQNLLYSAENGYPVGCISLEMRSNQLLRRLTCMRSGISSYYFRNPREMKPGDRAHARRTMLGLGDLPLWIEDSSGLNPGQIVSLIRQMKERGAESVWIDFVQIVDETGRDRREEINKISAAIRDAAKRLELPIIALSQLARRDANPNRMPVLSDLRESGNLEQDAHNVLLIHRPKDDEGQWTAEDLIIV